MLMYQNSMFVRCYCFKKFSVYKKEEIDSKGSLFRVEAHFLVDVLKRSLQGEHKRHNDVTIHRPSKQLRLICRGGLTYHSSWAGLVSTQVLSQCAAIREGTMQPTIFSKPRWSGDLC